MSGHIFTVDLGRCTGCFACAVACQDRAGISDDVSWLRVSCHEKGAFPQPQIVYRVIHCFHCANPSCIPACPTDAIARQSDGLVQIDPKACIGCGACVEACPFGAIYLSAEGKAAKCDGCEDEVAQGQEPTCVRACPMRALDYAPVIETPIRRAPDKIFDEHNQEPAVIYWVFE